MRPSLDCWKRDLREAGRVHPPRVLLAEDDEELRRLLATVLRQDGYEVVEASGGIELIELIAEQLARHSDTACCELLITDIYMPGATGLQAMDVLRRVDWAIPLIVITGFNNEETETETRRLGVAAVFEKPFDLDDFRTAVLNLLAPPRAAPARAAS